MTLFQTGDSLAGFNEYLTVPVDGASWTRENLWLALLQLTNPANWKKSGAIDVDAAASYFSAVWSDIFFQPSPIGSIIPYAGDIAPLFPEALPCDGGAYLIADYVNLFAVIGFTFGGSGSTFHVPDMRARMMIGTGGSIGGAPVTIGETGGAETHTQTVGELAVHNHTDTGHAHGYSPAVSVTIPAGLEAVVPAAFPGAGFTASAAANIANTGSSTPMNIMPPFIGMAYAIVTGVSN